MKPFFFDFIINFTKHNQFKTKNCFQTFFYKWPITCVHDENFNMRCCCCCWYIVNFHIIPTAINGLKKFFFNNRHEKLGKSCFYNTEICMNKFTSDN